MVADRRDPPHRNPIRLMGSLTNVADDLVSGSARRFTAVAWTFTSVRLHQSRRVRVESPLVADSAAWNRDPRIVSELWFPSKR